MDQEHDITWVTVYEAEGESEAIVIKGLLEASGIECIMDENESPYVIMGIPAHIPVFIKVMEADAAVAKELIAQPPPVLYE